MTALHPLAAHPPQHHRRPLDRPSTSSDPIRNPSSSSATNANLPHSPKLSSSRPRHHPNSSTSSDARLTHVGPAPHLARQGSPSTMPSRTDTRSDGSPAADMANSTPYGSATPFAHPAVQRPSGFRPVRDPEHTRPAAETKRPSSAPGNKQQQVVTFTSTGDRSNSQERGDSHRPFRPAPLQRSKSEHVLRHEESAQNDAELVDEHWGARHGYEDHYQSEDIISQLANVSSAPLRALRSHSRVPHSSCDVRPFFS